MGVVGIIQDVVSSLAYCVLQVLWISMLLRPLGYVFHATWVGHILSTTAVMIQDLMVALETTPSTSTFHLPMESCCQSSESSFPLIQVRADVIECLVCDTSHVHSGLSLEQK